MPSTLRQLMPKRLRRLINLFGIRRQGAITSSRWNNWTQPTAPQPPDPNPLESYFNANTRGPGIWKWRHYFEIYHRHLAKFRNRQPHVLEIGVYSGGSLGMWQNYFGPGSNIYGVDIEPACKSYEREGVRIFIGDQADRSFWTNLRQNVPALDIIIDDGGHTTAQQIATLEETLPYLRPGGVYICEDVQSSANPFLFYIDGLAGNLHAEEITGSENPARRQVSPATPFQSAVHSVHRYPYMVVIERNSTPVNELIAPKHGTDWQPFLK